MKNDVAIEVLDALAGVAAATAYERLGELGDGLPVAEPSTSVLDEMVAATGRAADDVILLVPPLRGPLTVRRLALCAALAGCEPRQLPVLVAACEALPQPELNAFGFLTTTGSAAPLLVVNGPAAKELGFSGGGNCLGPGNRANATVGRCVSLVVRILGGARVGLADMATIGQPAKYTCCFAENEDANPWTPFHVDRGFAAAGSAVTVTGIAGTVETTYAESGRTDDMLDAIAYVLAGSAPVLDLGKKRIGGGQPLVLLTPEWATQMAKVGLSKSDIRQTLYDRATRTGPDGEVIRVADTPDDVLVIVTGGVGVKQAVLPNWNGGARAVTRPIEFTPVKSSPKCTSGGARR